MSAGNEINELVEINMPSQNCSKQHFNAKSSVRQLNDTKREKIISIIQDDKSLWMKILRFSKVELKDVKEVLNKKGIIIENEILKEFLSELGVIFNQPR
jgi:transposase